MKIIRHYASHDNALNARTIIQDLLVSEIERMIDSSSNQNNLQENNLSGSEFAWDIQIQTFL